VGGGFEADSKRATSAGLGGGAADPGGATARGTASELGVRRMMVGPSSFSSSSAAGSGGGRAAPFFFPDSFFLPDSFAAAFGDGTVTGRAGNACFCSAPQAGQRATRAPRSTRRSTSSTRRSQDGQRTFIGREGCPVLDARGSRGSLEERGSLEQCDERRGQETEHRHD